MSRTLIVFAATSMILLLSSVAIAQVDEEGSELYQQSCATCHQPDGSGISGTFPPLAGNLNAADTEYVASVILEGRRGPITVDGVTYDGVMPAIPSLSEAQVDAVAAFVAALAGGGGGNGTTTTTAPVAPDDGDVDEGEALFTGAARLANGAPACASCHSVGRHDRLGGPGLGPDLTDLFVRFGGEAGAAAALANPPSATMTPLFEDHPLNNDEIADLTAFFAAVADEPAAGGTDLLTVFGLAGAAGLFGFLALFVRKPRGKYLDTKRGGAR
ncbi:MAG: cytochrome c [Acidimicrobiia bacterium]|nr:cytochrome c [Acidimicrobiia bacterium]